MTRGMVVGEGVGNVAFAPGDLLGGGGGGGLVGRRLAAGERGGESESQRQLEGVGVGHSHSIVPGGFEV